MENRVQLGLGLWGLRLSRSRFGRVRPGTRSEVLEKCAHHFAVNVDFVRKEEGVVPPRALHIAVADRSVVRNEGIDDLAGLLRREQPVAGETEHQPSGTGGPECLGQGVWS